MTLSELDQRPTMKHDQMFRGNLLLGLVKGVLVRGELYSRSHPDGFWRDEPERQKAMLLLEVARRYHEQGMGQADIASEMGYSRPTISRLLAEAKRTGVVTVSITHPLERIATLERIISGRYGIAHVRVTPNAGVGTGVETVGLALARFLDRALQPGMSIGLTTGRVHQAALDVMRRHRETGVRVVQLVGGSGDFRTRTMSTPDLVRRMADIVGGTSVTFDAPLIAATPQLASDLKRSPAISRVLRTASRLDLAVIGIGASFRHPADVFSDMLTSRVVREIHKQGAIGHVLGRFIDYRGRQVPNNLNDLMIGVNFSQLRKIPLVLGVAAGSAKAAAVAAALRGGLINSLVIDLDAAQSLAYLPERPAATEPLWSIPATDASG